MLSLLVCCVKKEKKKNPSCVSNITSVMKNGKTPGDDAVLSPTSEGQKWLTSANR